MELVFNEALHEYRLGGAVVPSVTQILAPIKQDFRMVSPAMLEAKRELGTAVHLACEWDDIGELDDARTAPEILVRVSAWRKFRADTGAAVVMNERKLVHRTLRFAGTLDRVAYLRLSSEASPSTWLLDIKTADDPHPSFGVQLAGYQILLSHAENANGVSLAGLRRGSVHLRADGTYRLHPYTNPNDEATFRACLAIAHWKESNK